MEQSLVARVLGQDEALWAVSAAIRSARGPQAPRRPVGVFVFAGATGTGKTELAKALAAFRFHHERRLVRIDMSEYVERHGAARLIGAPPATSGATRGSAHRYGPVCPRPYSVVLDEIEKAHPDVLNLVLQVVDEGQPSW